MTVGGQTVSLNLPPGPYLELSATGAQLTILGQTLSGDFAYTMTHSGSSSVTELTAANVTLSLGAGATQFASLTTARAA